ncbi:hypothetical protein ACTFIW_005254 [Dictyostelium discoideum]
MFKFPLTFLKRFNKNNSTKILTNKTIIDKPINYNGSSILYKALGFQCLGYNVHGIVHNNFNNKNRFYTQSKVFNDLHKNSNTSSSIKEIPTTTTKISIFYDDFVKTPQARSLVNYYGRSIIKICYSLFPNHNWVPWLFRQNNDLSSKRKQPDYNYHDEINWYASINNITESNLDQWYNVSLDEFRKVCKMFNAVSNNQLKSFIQKAYPHYKFDINKFNKLQFSNPISDVELVDSHIKKFNIALNSCGGSELDDVYNICFEDFKKNTNEGESLAYFYGKSIIKICYSLFPNHNWVPWLFKHNFELSNKRKQEGYDYHDEIKWYASVNNITDSNLDQWYNICLDEFRKVCKMIRTVSNSQLISFIEKAYPHYNFQPNKFTKSQNPTFELIEKHVNQFNMVLNSCGKSKLDDVYELGLSDFNNTAEGRSLVNYYGRSVIKICYALFPNHNWVPWSFKQNIELSNKRKQPDYDYHDEINWWASRWNITDSNLDRWYEISLDEFRSECQMGSSVSSKELKSFIQKAYPHHNFDTNKFRIKKYKEYEV